MRMELVEKGLDGACRYFEKNGVPSLRRKPVQAIIARVGLLTLNRSRDCSRMVGNSSRTSRLLRDLVRFRCDH